MAHEEMKLNGTKLASFATHHTPSAFVDPKGILRMALVDDLDVGRSVEETLRTIQAFKTGALCPVGWVPGAPTLDANAKANQERRVK